MWNKLFKKRQSEPSGEFKTTGGEKKDKPYFKCFSFRSGSKVKEDQNRFDDNFLYSFQQDLEIFKHPDFERGHEYSQLYQPEQHQYPDENQQLNEIFIEIPPPNLRLDLCPVCSRKFAPESLRKHVIICEKINTKKRKPFDSHKQRLHGTEFIAAAECSPTANAIKLESRVSPPKTISRKASASSLKSQPTLYFDRNYHRLGSMSRKSSTTSLASTTRSSFKRSVSHQNEKCPHCERIFGYKAYDRHFEWCKEKALIKPSADMASLSAAKERLKTRIGYRAPNLKTKRGATRDKYSNSCNGSNNSLADFDSNVNSMNSSMTSESGLYDPFLSAKKQLEELFSPTSAPSTQMINSMMGTSSNRKSNDEDIMSKSLTLNHVTISPKTTQPIPKIQNNFKRTSSLRISNRKPKPAIYSPSVKSNVHCGISDDGPISPNFVKATDFDELPIKSPYNAINRREINAPLMKNLMMSQSPIIPQISNVNQPMMRNKDSASIRKNLKLDLKNPSIPSSSDYPLSKTDSLALFLKYENDFTAKLSEKDMKDKSNSLSKKSQETMSINALKDHQKLPDINACYEEKSLVPIENQKTILSQNYQLPVKTTSAYDSLPLINQSEARFSPPRDRESSEKEFLGRRSGGSNTLRRQMKYNMENILFDTDPETSSTPSSSDNSKNNSLQRPSSKTSNTESIFEDFDFDQFIASFNDDDQFPIFKDYKKLLNREVQESVKPLMKLPQTEDDKNIKNAEDTSPIPIQKSNDELSGLEKLDNLCKMLGGDSDESNNLEIDHATRSKSSADSAYGSLSRHSQSPVALLKFNDREKTTSPSPSARQQLKTTEITLNAVKLPFFLKNEMIQPNSSSNLMKPINEGCLLSKFCHECGYKFVVPTAKFCIECGIRRVKIDQ